MDAWKVFEMCARWMCWSGGRVEGILRTSKRTHNFFKTEFFLPKFFLTEFLDPKCFLYPMIMWTIDIF